MPVVLRNGKKVWVNGKEDQSGVQNLCWFPSVYTWDTLGGEGWDMHLWNFLHPSFGFGGHYTHMYADAVYALWTQPPQDGVYVVHKRKLQRSLALMACTTYCIRNRLLSKDQSLGLKGCTESELLEIFSEWSLAQLMMWISQGSSPELFDYGDSPRVAIKSLLQHLERDPELMDTFLGSNGIKVATGTMKAKNKGMTKLSIEVLCKSLDNDSSLPKKGIQSIPMAYSVVGRRDRSNGRSRHPEDIGGTSC